MYVLEKTFLSCETCVLSNCFLLNNKICLKKTKRIFYMRQQSTKCQWWIEKPLKFSGFGKILFSHLLSNVPSILFRFSECLDPLLEKKKISPFPYPVLSPEICTYIFMLQK